LLEIIIEVSKLIEMFNFSLDLSWQTNNLIRCHIENRIGTS
jgi:hypothetical protein